MQAQWLGNLKGEDRDNFKSQILNSKIVLDKLQEIVYNMYTEVRTVNAIDYDCPSWSHKQAHTNGACETLEKILKLLDFKDQ